MGIEQLLADATAAMYEGMRRRDSSKFSDAIGLYNKVLEIDEGNFVALKGRGCAYNAAGLHQSAFEDFTAAIKLNGDDSSLWLMRGVELTLLDRSDDALRDFNKAIDLNDEVSEYYERRGVLLLGLGQTYRAASDFDEAIRLDPTQAMSYMYRCIARGLNNDLDEAKADIDRFIALQEKSAVGYGARAYLHILKGNNDWAIADAKRAIQLDRNDSAGWACGGIAFFNLEDYENAFIYLSRSLQLNKEQSQPFVYLGRICEDRGDEEQARSHYQKAVDNFDDGPLVDGNNFRLIAFAEKKLGRSIEAGDAVYTLQGIERGLIDADSTFSL